MKARTVLTAAGGSVLFLIMAVALSGKRLPVFDARYQMAPARAESGPPSNDSASGSAPSTTQRISESRPPTQSAPASLEALLDTLPVEEEAFLIGVNERYYHSLSFDNQAEFDRLVALGFPTPSEWLAAHPQSDDTLAERAQKGDIKAKMFLVDRMIERMDAIRRASPETLGISEVELVKLVADLTTQAAMLLRDSPSPFAAYVAGQAHSLSSSERRIEPIIASFIAGWERGDERARDLVYEFARRHPEEKATGVATSYFLIEGHKKTRQ